MTLWSAWWAWMLLAVLLGVVELLAPGWIALGFALGAALVGAGLLSGVLGFAVEMAGPYGAGALLLIYALLSLAAWIALRRVFGPLSSEAKTFDHDIND